MSLPSRVYRKTAGYLAPNVLAATVFAGGALLLLSGATPGVESRLKWLKDLLPLPVMELSHFLGSLVGVALLILARGLQRRLDAAYHLTVGLLLAGVVLSLLKGLDYEDAVVLSVSLLLLLPARSRFYRKAALTGERFTFGWILAILLVIAASIWLGRFTFKHVEFRSELWWKFAFDAHAPRFLRASVGAIVFAFTFALGSLLKPAPPEPENPSADDLELAKGIIAQCARTTGNLALLGDKTLLFNDEKTAFVMYGRHGRSWVAMGDPVGPEEELGELVWRFRELADRHGGRTAFYEVGAQRLHLYLDAGLTLVKLGEEARVDLKEFTLEGSARKNQRHTVNKIEKDGCSFEVVAPDAVPALLPEIQEVSDAWLAEKNTKEKGFSLGFFTPEYLKLFPCALVRKEGRIVAFANLWTGAEHEELSVDLMRQSAVAPGGVMEFLFVRLMLWGKAQGYSWFNLGMAPLAGLEDRALAPLWNKLGAMIVRHGEHFYNFQGLRQFKDKFDPNWEPKYLAYGGRFRLAPVLVDITALISGGFRGIFVK